MKMCFENAKVIVETRKNGVQPAIFIIEDGNVHMVTITPDGNFEITNEGAVGERYNENGNWCKQDDDNVASTCVSNDGQEISKEENDRRLSLIKIYDGRCPVCYIKTVTKFEDDRRHTATDFNQMGREIYICNNCGIVARKDVKYRHV